MKQITSFARDVDIELVRNSSKDDARFERKTAKDGRFYFNLKDETERLLGFSNMYSSESSMENGINSVKKNAPIATIVEFEETQGT